MHLTKLLTRSDIAANLRSTTKEGVIEELAALLVENHPHLKVNLVTQVLRDRERLGSTGIEFGIAIPHAKLNELEKIALAVGISHSGIDFNAHDGQPSKIFFVLLAPDNAAGIHLKTIARISKLLIQSGTREALLAAKSRDEIFNIISEEDKKISC